MHPLCHPLFIDYITYFNGNHDYFECHEVLEEYWKDVAPGDKRHPLVGYVQIATGMYHWRRGNTNGAMRIFKKGVTLLTTPTDARFTDYIDMKRLHDDCTRALQRMQDGETFCAFTMHVTNDALQTVVAQRIEQLELADASFLLDKHKLRDRSDVLQARAQKIASKQK